MWFWITSFLYFKYPLKWCTYSTVWLLHGWRHTKFLLSQHFLDTLYNHATFCKATYIECMCVCNLPPALLADWPESFSCYCSNTRLEWIPFSHESGALVTELSPLPIPFISISGGRILLYKIQCFEYMYKMQSYFMRQSWNIVICRLIADAPWHVNYWVRLLGGYLIDGVLMNEIASSFPPASKRTTGDIAKVFLGGF